MNVVGKQENPITVSSCLDPACQRVSPDVRFRDLASRSAESRVFAVLEHERLLGLVTERQAALFPNRLFADLLVIRQPTPLPGSAPLEEALQAFESERCEWLPIVDEKGLFLGATSRIAVFRCLLAAERRLRQQLTSTVRLLEEELTHHEIASLVFGTTSEGVMVTDAQKRILFVNRAFCDTTGYSAEEVIGKTPGVLSSGRHDAAFYAAMWHAINTTGHWSGEIWNRRKNGEIYPEYLHIDVVRDKTGAPSRYIGIFTDMTHDHQLQRRLYDLAFHDPLTGLPNRALFKERLEAAIREAGQRKGRFAVAFVDLDRFKFVNDTLGHNAGDELLRQAGQRLKSLLRDSDTVARLGGDEFTIIACDVGGEPDILAVARKAREALARPFDVEGKEIRVSASIGIAMFPDHGDSVEALLKHADTALYEAKRTPGQGWCIYVAGLGRRAQEQLELESALRAALENGSGLHLAWQPQVRLHDAELVGLEALARWVHPTLGPISPARFIPVVEASGLGPAFGHWLVETFVQDAALIPPARRTGLRFALNLSAANLRGPQHLLALLEQATSRLGITPAQVDLEITETMLMADNEEEVKVLAQLQSRGFQISVDDFGTGYSNLAYLLRFSVDRLKIDMSFVLGLESNPIHRQLVLAIVRMADALNLSVLAEGVETATQCQILSEVGCQEAQGYYFGRPMSIVELVERLVTRPSTPEGSS